MSKALESKFLQTLAGIPGKVSLHTVLSLTLTNIIILIFRGIEASSYEHLFDLGLLFSFFFIIWLIYIIGERLLLKYLGLTISADFVPETKV
jgi:hypothetical protein